MASSHLRVYYGPEDTMDAAVCAAPKRAKKVTVPLSDVLTSLVDAVKNRRLWLQDFENDEITISSDLYEVILAYEYHSRTSA
jgi:hypothetical protein